MEDKYLPIGFLDSGIGGLSVMRQALKELPNENFIFYGDNKNAPYGERSEEEIRQLTYACGEKLLAEGIKMLVIACNTMTTIAVRSLRDEYKIPVVSIEPAIKPALLAENSTNVVVFATPATLSQKRYLSLKDRVGHKERLIDVPCEGLAGIIEKGDFESNELKEYVTKKLTPYKDTDISGIVIGCTHYSFIAPLIKHTAKEVLGHDVELFDGLFGTVRQVKRVLAEKDLLNDSVEKGTVRLITSGTEHNIEIMKKILDM